MPATKTMAPELTWNEDWMLGARTARPALQVVECDDDGQDDERRSPVLAQSLAQMSLLAGARQHVLGEEDLLRVERRLRSRAASATRRARSAVLPTTAGSRSSAAAASFVTTYRRCPVHPHGVAQSRRLG